MPEIIRGVERSRGNEAEEETPGANKGSPREGDLVGAAVERERHPSK